MAQKTEVRSERKMSDEYYKEMRKAIRQEETANRDALKNKGYSVRYRKSL